MLAGGQPRRFRSDRAAAQFRGRTLLDCSSMGLRPHCDIVFVPGRFHPSRSLSVDHQSRGFGPLGGFAGAMQGSNALGLSHLLPPPCDTPDLPDGVFVALPSHAEGAFIAACSTIGLWQIGRGFSLDRHLAKGGGRAVRAWAESDNILPLTTCRDIINSNSQSDLASLANRNG